ncbi:hypothetical protein FJV41_19785 [Myxococcus llanfairpwllgwyngyllgogerychwyrndrobwllllantysiliogogogochensis]|uniref:Uncharacterized protein n=1 Tax=Myxococcus llanfairpwllgwyngyllgogerychwyrndrobwllllantysiliogogogochensis TaxID=2590453 RepID=A0A540WZ21_9BACT|nr:hypothetical protein [Myxococcus llanfairpwllgwyngyllgogerychwyrndrobwllllantysiliogogogochensis]TQF14213.1 hypothetical protein FJV41_19785 [Myxococcus llanfairpwllgwyngyllgogerychwyrndrobwllllantysiliogogogochensis]
MHRDRTPAQTPEQLRRKRVREDYDRALRQLKGEPEPQAPATPALALAERCYCGGPWLLRGSKRICGLGLHDD